MKHDNEKNVTKVIGIDLAKNSFQVHGVNQAGYKVMSKKMSRQKLKTFMLNLSPCLVGMEACGGAHYWARLFSQYGHQVKLIAPQSVKPFVKSNKNDAIDAEAICEAVQRPNMRFIAIKNTQQQDVLSIHRMRSLVVSQRTALVNQIRGILQEFGIVIPKGRKYVNQYLPRILEDGENGLSGLFREALHGLYRDLSHFDQRVADYDGRIDQMAQADEQAQRLMTIPGVGPKVATALLGAIGDISAFNNGRELAAWLGLVPRQCSTGGKSTLLGISKRGDVYIRKLLIHGARSVLNRVDQKDDRSSLWAKALKARRHTNIASVAWANKIIRVAFALLKRGEDYQVTLATPV